MLNLQLQHFLKLKAPWLCVSDRTSRKSYLNSATPKIVNSQKLNTPFQSFTSSLYDEFFLTIFNNVVTCDYFLTIRVNCPNPLY
ncbi:hypothetical protein H1P_230052 [Hyella patelloides LEGE 07179]|uniref:Uncharacterized protein n=1 Tax=Hyella patelloides LEGE 07179 TaxID=945734 RepID=A0A563VRA3_9CYAN|nr:hypothetical protein H1P_230052 [Hyella patelloides LEGE 07179]